MRTRNFSIRSKIIALVAVPLSALLALWIFATLLTIGPARNLLSAQTLLDKVGNPAEVLVGELQRERRQSVILLSDPKAPTAAIIAQRAATDRAAAEFRSAAGSDDARSAAGATLRTRIGQMFVDLEALPKSREFIDSREIDAIGAQGFFNSVIDTGFQMFAATATLGDETIDRQIRALSSIGHGQEYLSRVDSLLAGANTAGEFSAEARRELLADIGTSQYLLAGGVGDLPAQERANFQVFNSGTAFARVRQMEAALLTDSKAGAASPVTADQWQPAYDQSAQQLRAFEVNGAAALAKRANPVAVQVLIRLGAAALLGLLAVIVSLIVSIRVGRSIVGRLRRLRIEALEMAGERLPAVVRRLQRGEPVDVEVETPPLEYGRDEIGQVGHAFNEVQRTAVQSAVEEAGVRRGLNEVFLNIARRSQTLLHRQLALLDKMERRETEPQELEDLYRVDHLATRMRRHAEDLVILAGAAPGRGWRNPVPVIDVVRGAISEVEDYKRVDIRTVETAAILGRAVGDVIHLLAELLENAASFSPPQTRVLVTGQVLPNGYAVEIEDRGLGMSAEAIENANRRLGEPPDFDPADSARLGLFVVAQLAARHGIRVSLRPSAYGGVTAIVLVPGELITPDGGPLALPAGPTPADKTWDRPLVGTGTDDPSRHSLAALQWQGTEELKSITVPRRAIALNGSAHTAPAPAGEDAERVFRLRSGTVTPEAPTVDGETVESPSTGDERTTERVYRQPPRPRTAAPDTQELPLTSGPSPSEVAEGLSPDGLVQRRRTRPRPDATPAPTAIPAQLPAGLDNPDQVLHPPTAAPVSAPPAPVPVSAPPMSAPPMSAPPMSAPPMSAPPMSAAPVSAAPVSAAPVSAPPLSTQQVSARPVSAPPVSAPKAEPDGSAETETFPKITDATPEPVSAAASTDTGPALAEASAQSGQPLLARRPVQSGQPAFAEPSAQAGPAAPSSPFAPSARARPAAAGEELASSGDVSGAREKVGAAEAGEVAGDALLPKRVRQANLAPQLRAPVVEQPAAAVRSPEQVRSIMSALQWGTNRGRLAAAGLDVPGEKPPSGDAPTIGEAATVVFPAVRDSDGSEGKEDTGGSGAAAAPDTIDAAGGTAAHGDRLNRPEKDA